MSRATTERKRIERKRAAERLTMITRVLASNENSGTFLRAAAVHEAAHVIAAFHWDVPFGNRGVSITPASGGNDAVGFSDVSWPVLAESVSSAAEHNAVAYASWVATMIAPFAEYHHRADDADLDLENLLSSCRMDFAEPLGPNTSHDAAMNYGRVCFLLWMGGEKRLPAEGWLDGETGEMTRDLVHDADLMLRAYWEQICAFANALLGTDGLQMTAREVAQWRDEHFQRCDVVLSARS
jgi:hypothetical protein